MFESLSSAHVLRLRFGGDVEDLLARSLVEPARDFLSHPGKQLRGQLVRAGFDLGGGTREAKLADRGAELLESLHAGSLVVDDIQDESLERRGSPTLHRRYGVGIALNAGNWMYFHPLDEVAQWGLDPVTERGVYRLCHTALVRAHYGQALDVGVRIDELPLERIEKVTLASLELKTGALTSLALSLGGLLGGASEARLETLSGFGVAFGVALQMLDDLGNLGGKSPADSKRFEDLKLRRPSWAWAMAASMGPEAFEGFRSAVSQFPDETWLAEWLAIHPVLSQGKARALGELGTALRDLESALGSTTGKGLMSLKALCERLGSAYV